MAQFSIGDAIKMVLQERHWKLRFMQATLRNDWEKIVGTTIAKYTDDVKLLGDKVVIKTKVAALKHELSFNKELIIEKINNYLGAQVVSDLIFS
jgi:hypothetical protein